MKITIAVEGRIIVLEVKKGDYTDRVNLTAVSHTKATFKAAEMARMFELDQIGKFEWSNHHG